MNISLSPELERLIAEKLRSGRYRSADEVIREGLELLSKREREACPEASQEARPLAEIFASITKDVPESEWAHVPSDLSKNLDHYVYGSKTTS